MRLRKSVILFSAIALVSAGVFVHALPVKDVFAVTGADIQNAKDKQAAILKKKSETEADLRELDAARGNIKEYVSLLDEKQSKIEGNIADLTGKIKKQNKKIKRTKKELKAAKQTEADQYEIMKKRIRYMYENGSSDYVEILLGAKNIEDLLNRTEYMSAVSNYDEKLLENYKATKEAVTEKKKEQEIELADLDTMKAELLVDKSTNEKLLAKKQQELKKYDALVADADAKASSLAEAARAQENEIDSLIAKAEAEEAARKEAAEKKAAEEAARKAAAAKAAAAKAAANNDQNNNVSQSTPQTPQATNLLAGGLIWPMPSSHLITSGFGYRGEVTANSGTFHSGVDIGVAAGTPIIAAAGGTVVQASYHWSMGNYVLIDHGGGIYTVYMHCSKLLVSTGQSVSQGQQVGLVGSTGVATGPHLHFGLKINGTYVNPLQYVN